MPVVIRPLLLATLTLLAAQLSCTDPHEERPPEAAVRSSLQQRPTTMRLTTQRGRTGETLIRGGWGSAPGQFGRRTEASHPGPMSLAADGSGRLYLLDQVNRRVSIYQRDGRLARMIALESETVEDLAINAGSLWTLTYLPTSRPSYRVDRWDLGSGAHQLRVPLAPSIQLVTGLFADGTPGAQEVWVEVRHEAQVQVVRGGRGLPPLEQRRWRQGRASRGDEAALLLAAREGAAAALVQRVLRGQTRTALRVETAAPLIAITALSSDVRGRLYLGLLLGAAGEQPARRVLVIHDPAGSAAELLELANARVTDSFRPIAVGPDGSVYQLQSSEVGVTVLRWAPRGGTP